MTRPPSGAAQYTLNYNTGAVTNNSGDGYAFDDGAVGGSPSAGDQSASPAPAEQPPPVAQTSGS